MKRERWQTTKFVSIEDAQRAWENEVRCYDSLQETHEKNLARLESIIRQWSDGAHEWHRAGYAAAMEDVAVICPRRVSTRAWWDAFSIAWLAIGLQRRIDAAGMDACDEDVCPGCMRTVDDRTCWCGSEIKDWRGDGFHAEDHSAVPMGCECHHLPHVGEEAISYWRGRARLAETYLHGKVWYDPPKPPGSIDTPADWKQGAEDPF